MLRFQLTFRILHNDIDAKTAWSTCGADKKRSVVGDVKLA